MRRLQGDRREDLVSDVAAVYPSDTTNEWVVVDTVGTAYGFGEDEAKAREMAEPIGRRLFRRTVRRTTWSEVPGD